MRRYLGGIVSDRWRAWSTLSGSLLLHSAVLALVLAGPQAGGPEPASRDPQSPFGPSESVTGVLVDSAEPGARNEPIPVEFDGVPGHAERPPEALPNPRLAEAVTKPSPAPQATRPEPDAASSSATSREPATKELATPPQPTKRAEAESPYTEGEDWLGIGDEVEHSPSAVPAATQAPKSTAVGGRPSTQAEQVARDPLIQRLLAAEVRKAAAQDSKLGDPEQQRAPRRRRPAFASPAAEPSMAGVTDLPVGLARWLSYQAHAAPEWDRLALGDSKVSFRVLLRDGRIQSHQVVGKPPERMARAIEAAFFYLNKRRFSGGSVHSQNGEVELEVFVRITQLSRKNAQPGDTALQQDTTPSGRYLPSARVLRPSLRRVELRVDIAD